MTMAAAQVSGYVYNSIRLIFYLLDMQWSGPLGGGGGVDNG